MQARIAQLVLSGGLLLLGAVAHADDVTQLTVPNATSATQEGDWLSYRMEHEGRLETWVVKQVQDNAILIERRQVDKTTFLVLPRNQDARLQALWLDKLSCEPDWLSQPKPARLVPPPPPKLGRRWQGREVSTATKKKKQGESFRIETEWHEPGVDADVGMRLSGLIDATVPGLGVRELVFERASTYGQKGHKLVYRPDWKLVLVAHGSLEEAAPEPDLLDPGCSAKANLSFNPFRDLEVGGRAVFRIVERSRRPIQLTRGVSKKEGKLEVRVGAS